MAAGEGALQNILDDMALKILLIEPGDLSMVGELLEAVEKFVSQLGDPSEVALRKMGETCRAVLEKMIMGELEDSGENFSRLGQAVAQLQEALRKGGVVDFEIASRFVEEVKATGHPADVGAYLDVETGGSSIEDLTAVDDFVSVDMEESPLLVEEDLPDDLPEPPEPFIEEPPPAPAKKDAAPSLDFLQDKELLTGFIEEAFEHLESIEVNVLDLEQNPGDIEIINNIFRPFHTIKGVSGFLNLKTINQLAHATENLLDDIRNGKRSLDSPSIDIVLSVGDCLKNMVQHIKDVLEKGAEIYQDTDIASYIERINLIREGKADEVESMPKPAAPAVARVSSAPELDSETTAAPKARAGAPAPAPAPETPAMAAAPRKSGSVGQSIKVDIEKLDSLVNEVGELVIMQSLVRQNPLISRITDPKLSRDFSQLSRITTELQKTAMSMRMVPIRQTFDKMIRLVRDLSKKTGKKIDLLMEGADTEIDRNMVDSIYDPLVHMIRNSVDHGVGPPQERLDVGKPETGTVHLRAYHKGGNVVIEIEDDGEGLNTQKIRAKAIERKLIHDKDTLSDFEINNLVFLPGFSTADKITDVSGRGVGMDVVKKGVEKLRGKVEVSSTPGQGTQFQMRLPLTLAIIDGIIVRVGSERYVIPTTAIQESMKPDRKNYSTVRGKGENLLVRGRLVPIIRLYQLFSVKPQFDDPCDAIVVVVENEGRLRALMVDEVLGKEEVVIKSLGNYLKDVKRVAGGTILGDGRVGLILDLASIVTGVELSE